MNDSENEGDELNNNYGHFMDWAAKDALSGLSNENCKEIITMQSPEGMIEFLASCGAISTADTALMSPWENTTNTAN